jgi:mannosyl-oligosaccharide alpha-1,2-mannosidase
MKFGTWKSRSRAKQRIARYFVGVALVLLISTTFRQSFLYSRRYTKIQHDFKRSPYTSLAQSSRLEAVEREFIHAWTGYKDHSWMSDSLLPLTGGSKDHFCGWSATLVDSLDTLYIMGLTEEFDNAVNATTTIDFEKSAQQCQVNFFESTIRYLGGMLGAYDLSNDERLLPKLIELGDLLHSAFNSTNGMPCSHCNLGTRTHDETIVPDVDVPLADVATFYLEFARLGQITGNNKYLDTVAFITQTFKDAQSKSSIPGLWPERLDASSINGPEATLVSKHNAYSLGALSDSAYEYLVKAHLLLGGLTDQYADMWVSAASQIRQHLLFRAYIPQWNETDALFSGIATKSYGSEELLLEPRTQHLACFAGGMFAMASRIFNEPEDLEIGEALTNGCVWAYNNSPLGIMPETFTLLRCPVVDVNQCAWDDAIWEEARQKTSHYPPGFLSSIDPHYGLRPEAIESVFVLYRITGDPKWRDVGWEMFTKIIEHTRTPYGHASLTTVMEMREQLKHEGNGELRKMAAEQRDEMESFWLAETLKYFYLLFSDTQKVDLDEFVLNTEAHPFRMRSGTRGFP